MEVKCESTSGLSSKSDVSQTKGQGPVRWKSRPKSDESQTECEGYTRMEVKMEVKVKVR